MIKEKINTDAAPAAIGPYSQAVKAGDFIFLSGSIPVDPVTGNIVGNNAAEQAAQVFKNMTAVLSAAGSCMENVVKTTVFLKDMNDFAAVNAVYAQAFPGAVLPARSAVQVARLPKDVMVECEAIAIPK